MSSRQKRGFTHVKIVWKGLGSRAGDTAGWIPSPEDFKRCSSFSVNISRRFYFVKRHTGIKERKSSNVIKIHCQIPIKRGDLIHWINLPRQVGAGWSGHPYRCHHEGKNRTHNWKSEKTLFQTVSKTFPAKHWQKVPMNANIQTWDH